jgi:hypothetical protein
MSKFFLQLVKYACAILLIVIPCVAIIGIIAPWPVAENALGPGWAHKSVLVGVSYESQFSGNRSFERRTQTYVGLPSSQRAFQTVSVIQENGAVRTLENPYGLLWLLATYAALAAGTWWFWIHPASIDRTRASCAS